MADNHSLRNLKLKLTSPFEIPIVLNEEKEQDAIISGIDVTDCHSFYDPSKATEDKQAKLDSLSVPTWSVFNSRMQRDIEHKIIAIMMSLFPGPSQSWMSMYTALKHAQQIQYNWTFFEDSHFIRS